MKFRLYIIAKLEIFDVQKLLKKYKKGKSRMAGAGEILLLCPINKYAFRVFSYQKGEKTGKMLGN